ncbi:hypothetical protein D3C81_1626820 [compost metagenome]
MGDEQDGGAPLPSFFSQQQQHLTLYGHVEGGGRLVGNQQLRFAGERQRDHYPLAHASRQFEGIAFQYLFRAGDVHVA